MRGLILGFNPATGVGNISGDDGTRYRFVISEWQGGAQPRAGQVIDFVASSDEAFSLYPLPNQISAQFAPVIERLQSVSANLAHRPTASTVEAEPRSALIPWAALVLSVGALLLLVAVAAN